jgi:hypothetical protein
MRKIKFLLSSMIAILLLFSCNQKNETKEIDYGKFSIALPSTWKKVIVNGIDSEINVLVTPNGDSIYFDLGQYAQKFDETNKVFSEAQIRKYDSLNMDIKGLHSSDTPEIDQAQGTFLKEYYYYDTIDKKIGKIKVPKKDGFGDTGVYFKDVNKSQLTIIGKNLVKNEQDILVNSFHTIKFKN